MLSVSGVLDRFRRVDNKTTQRNVIEQDDTPFDALEQQLEMVEAIGQTSDYELGLKPMLVERIRELEALMAFSIESHAKLADTHGRLNEVRSLMELFEKSEGE